MLREPSLSAVDAFLKMTGIPGESNDAQHKGEISVLSFAFGASSTGAASQGGGGGAGKVCVPEISITKITDSSSPLRLQAVAMGWV